MSDSDYNSIYQKAVELSIEGKLEKALDLMSGKDFDPDQIKDVSRDAYRLLIKDQKVIEAITICEFFELPPDMKIQAINDHFQFLKENGRYTEALDWGSQYHIRQKDISDLVSQAFSEALKEGQVELAREYADNYSLSDEQVNNQARIAFNAYFKHEKFIEAFSLGSLFNLSRKRTLLSGFQGYINLMESNEIEEFRILESDFHILSDRDIDDIDKRLIDKFTSEFNKKILVNLLTNDKTDDLVRILKSINIFENYDRNQFFKNLLTRILQDVVRKHNNLLNDDRAPAAYDIAVNFDLLEAEYASLIRDDMIRAAEDLHNIKLGQDNLDGALFLKEKYSLFHNNTLENSFETMQPILLKFVENLLNKNRVDDADKVIREYKIDPETVEEKASAAAVNMTIDGQMAAAFELIRRFNLEVTDKDAQEAALERFHQSFEKGRMKIASDIAYYFRISEGRVPKANQTHWKSLLDEGHYKEALAFYKERKFSKELVIPVIKSYYHKLASQNKLDVAHQLRTSYKVNLSIVAWIMEKVKLFFFKR